MKKGNITGNCYCMTVLFFLFFTAGTLFAQLKTTQTNAFIALPPDKENLDVFQQWIRWNNPGSLLINHLREQANDHYEIRDREIAKLKTKSEWMKRQEKVKEKLMKIAGPFPERTPLNPKITGTIKKEGYRIENVIYESLPGFYVTASLFIPEKLKEPAPGILFCSGHSDIAYRRPIYQQPLINLVK